ncbi:RBM7 protein, partial [Corythaixoides concolor]|nr:RBM7 protein [Corythaixoides concolor]
QAGPVLRVKIPKDRDGRPKQFAFVNFKHEESVPYGLSLLNGIKLFGRPIKIQFRSVVLSPRLHGGVRVGFGGRHGVGAGGGAPAGFQQGREASASGPPALFLLSSQMPGAAWQQPQLRGKYEQPGFIPPGFPPAPHAFHPSAAPAMPRRPEALAPRKGRLSAHPYHPDSRHAGRGERAPDYGRGQREEHGYEDRHRDGWSHDYRRESGGEARWQPARH